MKQNIVCQKPPFAPSLAPLSPCFAPAADRAPPFAHATLPPPTTRPYRSFLNHSHGHSLVSFRVFLCCFLEIEQTDVLLALSVGCLVCAHRGKFMSLMLALMAVSVRLFSPFVCCRCGLYLFR